MTLHDLIAVLETAPDRVEFEDTLRIIEANYHYIPAGFRNGPLSNAPGENAGSCKIFAFSRRHGLSEAQTLHCFGRFYRQEVLGDPSGEGHRNIRQFMQTGWSGVVFDTDPLTPQDNDGR
ncbi:HopJ type III effector protein [Modicisalibacter luteus]|uniref:HopJ type III effector protein n=1 Tax=Modicisalibacter luteus TaxID=453962 RepID=A0ABV7M297_9GAMM|nr:HopJ type III effector protein [Halomonas lutea]GHA83543.1 type III effector [Halomonas lutea]